MEKDSSAATSTSAATQHGIPQSTAKVRLLIISDTHTAELLPESLVPGRPFRIPLPKADVLIHCGDMTYKGEFAEFEKTVDMLDNIDAELKLVIAGNHDGALDEVYWKKLPGKDPGDHERAVELWTKHAAQKGITYLDEGMHTFTLKSSGATFNVYSSQWTPALGGWAFPYGRAKDRFNPPHAVAPERKCIAKNPVPDFPGVDLMITHGPPKDHLDMAQHEINAGCVNLWRAVRRARPRVHCFGHIHEGWGAQRLTWNGGSDDDDGFASVGKEEDVEADRKKAAEDSGAYFDGTKGGKTPLQFGENTLLVNASIMDEDYSPKQSPWLVDLDLPVGGQ